MNALIILRVALRSLLRAPVRSALTALGVIVGVAAVVATVSIGGGAKANIEDALSRPEARVIHLGAVVPRTEWRLAYRQLPPQDRLRVEDYYEILRAVPNIIAASPRIYAPTTHVQANGHASDVIAEAMDVDGFATADRQVIAGAGFSHDDVRRASNVCVLSESLTRELFATALSIGRSVRINGIPFTVVGVVNDVVFDNPMRPNAKDLHVFVPFTSMLRRLDRTAEISISVQADDIAHVPQVQQAVSDVMELRRNGRKAEFRVSNSAESIKAFSQGSQTMARLLAAIGAISLVVGGIGIMNIMLVSVTERTREIGVRMAVGTRSRDVLRQFLIESTALSLMGGLIGIAIGVFASWLLAHLNEWPTKVTTTSIIVAFLCSLVVGIFFGYHPARRAADLEPVEALRAD